MIYVHISICSMCSRRHEGCIRLVDSYGSRHTDDQKLSRSYKLDTSKPRDCRNHTTTPMFHILYLFPNCQRPSQTHTKPVASAKVTAQMLAGKDHEIPSSVGWNALLQGILWLSDYLMSCSCPLINLNHLGPAGYYKYQTNPSSQQ